MRLLCISLLEAACPCSTSIDWTALCSEDKHVTTHSLDALASCQLICCSDDIKLPGNLSSLSYAVCYKQEQNLVTSYQHPVGSKLHCGAGSGSAPSFSRPLLKLVQMRPSCTATSRKDPNPKSSKVKERNPANLHKWKCKAIKNTPNTFIRKLNYFLLDTQYWKCNSFEGGHVTHLWDFISLIVFPLHNKSCHKSDLDFAFLLSLTLTSKFPSATKHSPILAIVVNTFMLSASEWVMF